MSKGINKNLTNWIGLLIAIGIIGAVLYVVYSNFSAKKVDYSNPGGYEVCVANEQNRILDQTNYGSNGPSEEQTQAAFQYAQSLCD